MIEIALLGVLLLIIWYYATRLPDNYPPTPPIRLPILGHAHYLLLHGPVLHETFKRYSKNGLLSLHIGTLHITMIGNGKMVKEIFTIDDANYRHPQFIEKIKKVWVNFQDIHGDINEGGIITNQGKGWHEQRKFLVYSLKELGVGNQGIEGLINVFDVFKVLFETLKLYMY